MRKLAAHVARLMLLTAVAVLMLDAVFLGLKFPAYGVIALVGIAYRMTRNRWQSSWAYGTARAAGLSDLLAGNMLADRGLILARAGNSAKPSKGQALRSLLSPRVASEQAVRLCSAALFGTRRADDFIRVTDFVHLATFAPAGGGKSVSVLYPNLLSYDGNCVVIDPKGELYAKTHKHRANEFGHTIVRLDPAGLYGPGADCFNPLNWIDPKRADFIEQCRDVANQLVIRTGKEMDPHWCDSAENVICAFIAYICALEGNPDARNLHGVRQQIASRENYAAALEVMRAQEGLFHGVLEEMGHSLSWHVDKELGSVMTHAQRFTNIFGAPLVAACTGSSTFDPKKLRTGRMTIYLITPADKMTTWASLQRVWLGSLLRIITQGTPSERNPVLFLVDECAHIGKMQVLEDAITLMRGMGIRLWLFFQSQEQLKKCFGDNAGTVLDNLATQQYFSINSLETAKAISERIGDETVVIRTEGGSYGTSANYGGDGKNPGSRNRGTSYNYTEIARKLLQPSEVLTMPEHAAIVFHKNNYVIVCNKIRYFADKAFRQRGILRKRYGTGRTRGHSMTGLVLGLAALAVAYGVTLGIAQVMVRLRHPHAAVAPRNYDAGGYSLPYGNSGFDQ
jgi:type IV secretion system protein VirD4